MNPTNLEEEMFLRRIGPDPHADGQGTPGVDGCPDIWELNNGDFAIIGAEATASLKAHLPSTASCGSDESIVVIPRKTLVRARLVIPES